MPNLTELKFPSRAQRRQLMEQLKALQNDPQTAASEEFRKYVESFTALDAKMNTLYEPDENGLPKLLEEEDAKELCRLLTETGTAGENFLAYSKLQGQDLTQGTPAMVDKLQSLLARDFEALNTYDPAVKTTLPELQEKGRTRTVDLRGRKLGSMGNKQNSRIPMTLVNAKGEKRKGVFTKAVRTNILPAYREAVERAKAKCGNNEAAKQKLDDFLNAYRSINVGMKMANGRKLKASDPDELFFGLLMRNLFIDLGKKPITLADLQMEMANAGIDIKDIPEEAMATFAADLTKLKDDPSNEINGYNLGLKDGTRMDTRNSAMSTMAGLLGIPHLVAKAEPMKFIAENGKEYEGTFMDFAKGYDVMKNLNLLKHVAPEPYGKGENRGRLFRQIADLQVLDYLCMNVDRHVGNLIYQIDKEGHLTGIQAIDNDSSFGPLTLSKTRTKGLRVISTEMKKTIFDLKPEMLRFALRGQGLSEEEIEAAIQRHRMLKAAVEKGEIREMNEQQMALTYFGNLRSDFENVENQFNQIDKLFVGYGRLARNGKPFTPIPDLQEPEFKEVETTDRRRTIAGLTDSMNKVARLVQNEETGFNADKLTVFYRGGSDEFTHMLDAAKQTKTLMDTVNANQELDKSRMIDEAESIDTLIRVNESFDEVEKKSLAYLQHKIDERHDPNLKSIDQLTGRNEYEQKRIDYAKSLLKAVNQYRTTLSAPGTEEEKAALEANQDRRELEQRRKDAQEKEQPVNNILI